MKQILSKIFAAALLAASTHIALAADSFQGSVWTLSYSGAALPDVDPLHQTYRVTLGVDTSGYTGGGSFLDQVAIKVSSSVFSFSLFSAPGNAGSWSTAAGGISASGCSGSGSGFMCANSGASLNSGRGVSVSGSPYSWIFDVTVNNGVNIFDDPLEASVKGRFVGANGLKIGDLVSENITMTTPVPEPEIYAMMAAGLGMIGWARRRKQKQGAAA